MTVHRVLEASHRLCLVDTVPPMHLEADAVCGDLVDVEFPSTGGARITEVLPRRTALARARLDGDDDKGVHVIAANVDVVAVCAPLDRPVSQRFLERGIALAHASGARPLVLLTKRDVVDEIPVMEIPGVDVVAVSALDAADLEIVRAFIAPGETLVLLGASGAGKSTLANALMGGETQRTASVREEDGRGRHTTTQARLLSLPWGAFLVDTPGVRSLGLVGDEDDVGAAFPDIDERAAMCRFRDCDHESEPGCNVRGFVDEDRLASFHALVRESRRRARNPWDHDPQRALSVLVKSVTRNKRR